jgi:hypothetical protein
MPGLGMGDVGPMPTVGMRGAAPNRLGMACVNYIDP